MEALDQDQEALEPQDKEMQEGVGVEVERSLRIQEVVGEGLEELVAMVILLDTEETGVVECKITYRGSRRTMQAEEEVVFLRRVSLRGLGVRAEEGQDLRVQPMRHLAQRTLVGAAEDLD